MCLFVSSIILYHFIPYKLIQFIGKMKFKFFFILNSHEIITFLKGYYFAIYVKDLKDLKNIKNLKISYY